MVTWEWVPSDRVFVGSPGAISASFFLTRSMTASGFSP